MQRESFKFIAILLSQKYRVDRKFLAKFEFFATRGKLLPKKLMYVSFFDCGSGNFFVPLAKNHLATAHPRSSRSCCHDGIKRVNSFREKMNSKITPGNCSSVPLRRTFFHKRQLC